MSNIEPRVLYRIKTAVVSKENSQLLFQTYFGGPFTALQLQYFLFIRKFLYTFQT